MVEHSDEVDEIPRLKWPRRFPVPRNFGVPKGSRIVEGTIMARTRGGNPDRHLADLPFQPRQ